MTVPHAEKHKCWIWIGFRSACFCICCRLLFRDNVPLAKVALRLFWLCWQCAFTSCCGTTELACMALLLQCKQVASQLCMLFV